MLNNYYLTVKLMSKLIQWLKFKYRFSTRAVLCGSIPDSTQHSLLVLLTLCALSELSLILNLYQFTTSGQQTVQIHKIRKKGFPHMTINLSAFRKPWSIKTIDKSNPFVPDLFQRFQSALMCQNKICTDSRCIAYQQF